MPKKAEFTDAIRHTIINLAKNASKTHREITANLQISQSAVTSTLQNHCAGFYFHCPRSRVLGKQLCEMTSLSNKQ